MKKIIAITLAMLVLLCSAFSLSAGAADMTNQNYIYFQVPTADGIAWKNFSTVFCHIWQEGDEGGDFYAWQAKDEKCEDLGNGYYSYDITGLTFKEDGVYSVIFSNENGKQTYNLTLTSACKGDIVVCDGDTCVNPVDNAKQCTVARWMENADTVHPCAQVSSDGAMVDPDGISGEDVDLTWGNSEGVSIEMPEVKMPEPATDAEPNDTQSGDTDTNPNSDWLPDDLATQQTATFPLWIIITGIAVAVAVVAVVIIVVVMKKKNK